MQGFGVNNSVNSNIYAYDAVRVYEKYADFTQGDANCTVVVVSEFGLGDAAVDALRKSVERLGYGLDAGAWVRLHLDDGRELDADALCEFIEGADPISIVACDVASAGSIARAYADYGDRTGAEGARGGVLGAGALGTSAAGKSATAADGVGVGDSSAGGAGASGGSGQSALQIQDGQSGVRFKVACDALNRVNGRSVVAFRDFESMLNDKDSKQVAWSLLKKL